MFKRTPKIYRLYPLIHICMFFSPYKKVVQGLFVKTPSEMGFFRLASTENSGKNPTPIRAFAKVRRFIIIG